MPSLWQGKKICVTGGAGFIGSHLVDKLVQAKGVRSQDIFVPRSKTCDLRLFENCREAVKGRDIVIHMAATVGGVQFNMAYPADQYYRVNLINLHMMEAARLEGVGKFVAVSCICAYPREAQYPLVEEDFNKGRPEEAHGPYGFAKQMMSIQAEAYHKQYGMNIALVIPANAYGPRDNFNEAASHVIPATIRKCFEQKELVVWGDGSPTRDFLYVEDAADGILLAAEKLNNPQPVNIATGEEISIRKLIETIVRLTNFKGKVTWDVTKPAGQPRRLACVDRATKLLGFKPGHSLEQGLQKTIDWYLKNLAKNAGTPLNSSR